MKKYILLCLLCCCFPVLTYAQFYLKGYTGYALSTGTEKLTSEEGIRWRISGGEDYRQDYGDTHSWKYGQGVNLGLAVGYKLNQHIAVEITGNTQVFTTFLHSTAYQWSFTYEPETVSFSWYAYGFFGDLEYTNTLFQVSPQVVFTSTPYRQWTFYLKGGPDFLWVKHERTTKSIATTFDSPYFGVIYDPSILYTTEYTGKMSIGVQCSFGTEYKLSERLALFAELTAVFARYTFTKENILRYEIDGVDSLSQLESTTSDRETKPLFNHTGINVGVKYSL